MVKSKQRQQQRNRAPPSDESDWMMVKKQIITILIPPLPNKARSTTPSVVNEGPPQENPKITISSQSPEKSNPQSKSPSEDIISASKQPLHETEKKLSISSSPKQAVQIDSDKGCKRSMMIFDGSVAFVNRRMRASFLERKLKRAGGLENWLVSLGLARFVKVFRRRNVSKFQLANISMKKLKDMGADAVGPRRKLMHAIDCLCQPHCFHHV
ncbi:hypothetical protein ABFX02_10G067200 [Erythranthe guttata]